MISVNIIDNNTEKVLEKKEFIKETSSYKEIDNKIKLIYKDIENKYNISKTTLNLELEDYEKDITFSNFDDRAKRILRRKDLEVVFVQCDNKNFDKVVLCQ